jgi:hypothetical protein
MQPQKMANNAAATAVYPMHAPISTRKCCSEHAKVMHDWNLVHTRHMIGRSGFFAVGACSLPTGSINRHHHGLFLPLGTNLTQSGDVSNHEAQPTHLVSAMSNQNCPTDTTSIWYVITSLRHLSPLDSSSTSCAASTALT